MAEIEFNRQARIHISAVNAGLDRSKNTTIGVQYPGDNVLNGYSGIKNIISGSMQLTRSISESGIQFGTLISSEYLLTSLIL